MILGYFLTPQVFLPVIHEPNERDGKCHILLVHNIGGEDYLIGYANRFVEAKDIHSSIPPGVQKYPRTTK